MRVSNAAWTASLEKDIPASLAPGHAIDSPTEEEEEPGAKTADLEQEEETETSAATVPPPPTSVLLPPSALPLEGSSPGQPICARDSSWEEPEGQEEETKMESVEASEEMEEEPSSSMPETS
jgi:hypothetical protein